MRAAGPLSPASRSSSSAVRSLGESSPLFATSATAVASVELLPDSQWLQPGDTARLICVPRNGIKQGPDSLGATLGNTCTWKSRDTTTVKLVPSMRLAQSIGVVARKVGATWVDGKVKQKQDSAWLGVSELPVLLSIALSPASATLRGAIAPSNSPPRRSGAIAYPGLSGAPSPPPVAGSTRPGSGRLIGSARSS